MDSQKIKQLQAMIQKAEFLNEATKKVFLEKVPYLNEKKFEDLYEVFEHDLEERKKIYAKRINAFESYKAKVKGIYQKAKQVVIGLKEKAVARIDEGELSSLDQELDRL